MVDDDDRIPDMPPNPTEADQAEFMRKFKRYEDRDYWKRRGKNSGDETTGVRQIRGNDSYPMRAKIPEQFNKYFMPEFREEDMPLKKHLRYYEKGGNVSAPLKLTPQEQKIVDYHRNTIKSGAVGLDQHGNPVTVYTTTIPVDERNPRGAHANVPGYVGGKVRNREELQQLFKDEIAEGKWPVYPSGREAGRRAAEVHSVMDNEYEDALRALKQNPNPNRVVTD